MIRLLPPIAKTPPAFEDGGPKPIVPVNGWPFLQLAVMVATVATVAPNGIVLGIDGFGGLDDKLTGSFVTATMTSAH
jgi:hypothetical protein